MTQLVASRQLFGLGARWHTEALGEFFCPECGGDRNYRRQGGRRWLRLLGLPVLPLGDAGTTLQCTSCRARYGMDALERPTSGNLLLMLRTAQYTIALSVLAAGGTARSAREAAVGVIHEAGYPELDEPQVLAALADGPYRPTEREALRAAGRCLKLSSERIDATLEAAARQPHP